MNLVRPTAVAGLFYDAASGPLRASLSAMLESAPAAALHRPPRILILPHAGYVYSGRTAAAGYKLLSPHQFQRVVILCPAHSVPLRGMALPECSSFATPLGEVPLDLAAMAELDGMPAVARNAEAHRFEHAIEVQLPFLQYQLQEFKLVPLVVGHCPPAAVAEVLERLMDDQTLLVVSTDLSHYLTWDEANQKDEQTIAQILQLNDNLDGYQACGSYGLNGALLWAREQGLTSTLLSHCNSGDSAGTKDRVVGYAAVALY